MLLRCVATAGLLLALAALCLGCAEPAQPRPNLLLISIDTLRADRLGAWGYGRATSPHIDALAREAVVFEDAQAGSSWTLPTLASLMTSLYSSTHRCWTHLTALGEDYETLAELLEASGWKTAAVVNHVLLSRRHGLHQGFESYDESLIEENFLESHAAVTSPQVTRKGLDWLAQGRDQPEPWFLWLHYFDPHALYRAHQGLSDAFGTERPSDLYDGEIAFTDRAIGHLLAGLAKLGMAERTVVLLFADHGEEFGDHGGTAHGHTLHRELLHVPLLIRAPGFAPRRVSAPVRQVDVMPTALELLGLPVPEGLEGTSLLAAMRGEPLPDLPVLGELRQSPLHRSDSLQRGGWKLLVDRARKRTALYDLKRDPGEHEDVATSDPDRVREMRDELEAMIAGARRKAGSYRKAEPLTPLEDETESLRQLGYIE
jgi:arylsulfatase A-like enzyme